MDGGELKQHPKSATSKALSLRPEVGQKLTVPRPDLKSTGFQSFLRFKQKKSRPNSPKNTKAPTLLVTAPKTNLHSRHSSSQVGRLFSSLARGSLGGKLRSRLSNSGPIEIADGRSEKPSLVHANTDNLKVGPILGMHHSKSGVSIVSELSKSVSVQGLVSNNLQITLPGKKQTRVLSAGMESSTKEFARGMLEKSVDSKYSRGKSTSKDVKEVQSQHYYMRNLEYHMRCDSKSSYAKKVKEHLEDNFKAVKESMKLRKPTDETLVLAQLRCPPPLKKRYTVVLDLDETLVHVMTSPKAPGADHQAHVVLPDGQRAQVSIFVRPFLAELIKKLKPRCELAVWTAGRAEYANCVLSTIDPLNEYFDLRLFRDQCYATSAGQYVKDLRILNRSLERSVIVDNSAYSYAFQLENGVPILPFLGEKNDTELLLLGEYLSFLTEHSDIRDFNRKHLRLKDFEKSSSLSELKIRLLKYKRN
jgi:Dullard-like phosphatase family protein